MPIQNPQFSLIDGLPFNYDSGLGRFVSASIYEINFSNRDVGSVLPISSNGGFYSPFPMISDFDILIDTISVESLYSSADPASNYFTHNFIVSRPGMGSVAIGSLNTSDRTQNVWGRNYLDVNLLVSKGVNYILADNLVETGAATVFCLPSLTYRLVS